VVKSVETEKEIWVRKWRNTLRNNLNVIVVEYK
jgi:hypothetical protein